MHEYSFTKSIVDAVLTSVEGYNVKRVQEINLEMGEFATFIPEQVAFCFEILGKEHQILQDTLLQFTQKKGVLKCESCGYRGGAEEEGELRIFTCPKCKNYMRIIEGMDCIIKEIKLMEI